MESEVWSGGRSASTVGECRAICSDKNDTRPGYGMVRDEFTGLIFG